MNIFLSLTPCADALVIILAIAFFSFLLVVLIWGACKELKRYEASRERQGVEAQEPSVPELKPIHQIQDEVSEQLRKRREEEEEEEEEAKLSQPEPPEGFKIYHGSRYATAFVGFAVERPPLSSTILKGSMRWDSKAFKWQPVPASLEKADCDAWYTYCAPVDENGDFLKHDDDSDPYAEVRYASMFGATIQRRSLGGLWENVTNSKYMEFTMPADCYRVHPFEARNIPAQQ